MSSEIKVKTTVRIGGLEYAMSGFESEEYMHRVAILVDRKMQDIERAHPALSTSQAAILVAINLADELLKQREENEALDEKINKWREESFKQQSIQNASKSTVRPYIKSHQ